MKTNIQCAAMLIISCAIPMNSMYCMNNHVSSKYNVEMGENRLTPPKIAFKSSTISSSSMPSFSTPSLSMMSASSQTSIIPHSQNPSQQDNGQTEKPRSPSIICGENHNQGNVIEIYNVIVCRLKCDMANATVETKNKKALELLHTYGVFGTIPEKAHSNVIEYIQKEIKVYRQNTNDVVVDIAAIETQQAAQQSAPDEHELSGLKLLDPIPGTVQAQHVVLPTIQSQQIAPQPAVQVNQHGARQHAIHPHHVTHHAIDQEDQDEGTCCRCAALMSASIYMLAALGTIIWYNFGSIPSF